MATEVSRKGKRAGREALLGLGEAAWMLARVVLAFLAITAAVVLGGLAYYALRRRGFGSGSVSWLFRLSVEQLVALGFGAVVALALLSVVWMVLTRRGAPHGLIRRGAALAVLALYLSGSYFAYCVSRNLNRSPHWACIHALYSWPYVGVSFAEWATDHPKQPLVKTLRQFRSLMGL